MSKLKVAALQGLSASSDAITLANDGTCTANITNRSNRNLIINGAMQVAQRGTSSTSTGYQTVDRFQIGTSGVDEAPTQAQADVAAGTTPYTLGFRKALKITNGNQTSGAGASDVVDIKHIFEAQDIANSGWNYLSSSSYITLSFWVKSSVAQNFFGHVKTYDGTAYNYPFSTGSLSSDTWTKITKTIPGNSNLQIDNDNGAGLEIRFALFYGTDKTASVSENAWAAYNNTQRTPDNTSTWYTTNDATFEITGVQLEVSDHATSFEHEPEYVTFPKCQRYFQYWYHSVRFPSTSSNNHAHYHFVTPMRAAPTVVRTGDQAGSYESGSTTGVHTGNSQYKYYYSGLLSYGNSSGAAVGGYGTLDAEL
jgi:hypothetical protein